jgi:hypothetical protein
MSVTIDRKQHFLAIPLVTVRNVLHAWRFGSTEEPHEIARRSNIKLHPSTVMVLLEELRDRGLIGPEEDECGNTTDGLTHAGLALATASARKRTPKAKAREVLVNFLEACGRANARNDLPIEVQEVWLFGSMINPEKEDVADIDLVMISRFREDFQGDRNKRFEELAKEIGGEDVLWNRRWYPGWATGYVFNHVLHQGRRHPLLAFGSTNLLAALACPCQLIFDAARGGIVNDRVLMRHPTSQGRAKTALDKLVLPDLGARRRPIRPISASLANPIVDDRGSGWWARIVSAPPVPSRVKQNALMKRLNLDGCNGRERVCAISCDGRGDNADQPKVAVIYDREIVERDETIDVLLQFRESAHLGRRPNFLHIHAIFEWIATLLAADIERVMRRDEEIDGNRSIVLKINNLAETWITEYLTDVLSTDMDLFLQGDGFITAPITIDSMSDQIAAPA